MAAGFAQGTFDAELGAYVITERDAHTWVEAYFPGYGWIEFEPTAAQAPLTREGDNVFSQQEVAPPEATFTPQPTFTPLPTNTPEPTSTPDAPTPQDDSFIPPTPTITPTFTPTPTVTPVIIPTQPAPIPRQSESSLESILSGLLKSFFLLVFLVVVIGSTLIYLYWWWEWRGMKGLSPVARAYARLNRYLGLLGLHFGQQHTPEERRRQIVRNIPKAERPVTAITRLYTTERYGPGYRHPAEAQRNREIADDAWPDARKNILTRWLRRFIPWARNK
jgi:hypothetical protein